MYTSTLLVVALCVGAPAKDPLERKAEELVAKLGDKSYRVREEAARDLLEIGWKAKDAVLAGSKNTDGEIADRCRKLYPELLRRDIDKLLEPFVAKPESNVPVHLPAVDKWLKITGDTPASRKMYADVCKMHLQRLIDFQQKPDSANQMFAEFAKDVYTRGTTGKTVSTTKGDHVTAPDLWLYLFLGSAGTARGTTSAGLSSTYYYQFLNCEILTNTLTAAKEGDPSRKLFAGWLGNERYSIATRRGMDIAAKHKVTECASEVLKVAKDAGTTPYVRASAIIGFGRIGTQENLKELDALLKDETQIAVVSVNGKQGKVLVKDVALGAAWHLVGQNPAEHGFERTPPASTTLISTYTYYAFSSDETRAKAIENWKTWTEKNLKK